MDIIPTEAPEPTPVTLVTMTVVFELKHFINLKLVSEYIEIDDQIVGVKYENTVEGTGFKPKKANKNKVKKSNDFKNQCTLNINAGGKILNVKLFNNGKLVFTGCTDIEQIKIATDILTDRLLNLHGELTYDIPDSFRFYSTRDIFKKEIVKYRVLIHSLVHKLNIDVDTEAFNPALDDKEAYSLFMENSDKIDNVESENILILLQIVNIIKSYYNDDEICSWKDFPEFVENLLTLIDFDQRKIIGDFPSYLGNDTKITAAYENITISNILKRMSCNFSLNREMVFRLLQDCSNISHVEFDEDRYSGVVAKFQTTTGIITIIFFNSGKINITAATSDQQIDEAHQFVSDFCKANFSQILMVSDYLNKKRAETDSMPDRFEICEHEGVSYILLKKDNILKNPRNVLLLRKFGLIENYEQNTKNLS